MRPRHFAAMTLLAIGLALMAVSYAWMDVPRSGQQAEPPAVWSESRGEAIAPSREDELAVSGPDAAPASDAQIVRVSAPRIKLDAAVEVLGLTADGGMQDPRSPTAVAWYDFSGRPGSAGNVVLAGHVDYYNYGPAVFWRLRDLKLGDEIELALEDGSVLRYAVASLTYYDAASAPVDEIVGRTAHEQVTLITCGGSFNRSTLDYNQRLIVRAIRV